MVCSAITSATTVLATINRSSPTQASMMAPYTTSLKSTSAFPVSRKANTGMANNMGKKKFETLSYLPSLSQEQLTKEIEYLLRMKWIPCLEFQQLKPGYYDGRYWTMWKLPMFGCTDAGQVLKELEEARKIYPNAFVRIIGFDAARQVQCISFTAYKPAGS